MNLQVGSHTISPPVVLAPMAGITNAAFRQLCREYGAGLYVSEMVTARAFVEEDPKTLRMTRFQPDEAPRSLQFYSVDPAALFEAVRRVAADDLADHIDLNFGCPVKKVTRKGGGAALPWKRDLFAALVDAALRGAAGRIPVTVKMRIGIDAEHETYLEAGKTAAEKGVSWVALHARTAQQYYGGQADWSKIARLKDALAAYETPVLGNGDIFAASDAVDMMARTGCDGVVVGRGCLGRPWLFGQLADALSGREPGPEPNLVTVVATYRRHAELLVQDMGEHTGTREIRKHHAWYFKGFSVPREVRAALGQVESLDQMDEALSRIDTNQHSDSVIATAPRGRTSKARDVALPAGWLQSRELAAGDRAGLHHAETADSGG
ncbi:tRNA dihydrouridine synthase DusB [Candidatus Nanopelagicales bacterium]|nr:tRNA dihydrouridine synthase DusB [Candidatus Nanopelagicales bacterium]